MFELAITDDAVKFITDQIAVIVSLVLTVIMGFRWLHKENTKHSDKLEIRLLGKDKDGRGGVINDLRSELKSELVNYIKAIEKDNRYTRRDVGRIEKTLERITRGRYVFTKSQITDEEIDASDDYDGAEDLK